MSKIKATKRDMILDSAYSLFVEKGYCDTKIIDIADSAGIGKGTVYQYFESKDAIFVELFKTKVASGYDSMQALLEKDISCEKKVKEYIEIELLNTAKFNFNRNFMIDLMTKSDAFKNLELVKGIHDLVGAKFKIMFDIIEQGINIGEFNSIDPLLATVSVMGAINFYTSFHYCPINVSEYIGEEKVKAWDNDEFIEIILKGLRN